MCMYIYIYIHTYIIHKSASGVWKQAGSGSLIGREPSGRKRGQHEQST